MASREVFHFDEFALDVGERRLLRGTETVRLSPKAYDVLVVLVRQSGGWSRRTNCWRMFGPSRLSKKAFSMFTWQHCARRSATTRGLRPTSKPSCGQGIASSLQSGLIRATRSHSHRAPWRVQSNFTSLSAAAGLICCQARTSSCLPPWTPFIPGSRSIRPMHRRTPAWRTHGACKQRSRARDPRSAFVLVQIATSYWHQRKYDDTLVWAQRALDVERKHVLARQLITHVCCRTGE